MADRFTYDVFLSHNVLDKVWVRGLAEELRTARLRVLADLCDRADFEPGQLPFQ